VNAGSSHLVLVGMMGVGKTTTARALAARLGWPMRDCDLDLEERTGRTGATLAADEGLAQLHRHEEELLHDALADDGPLVITAAGSVVESSWAREELARSATVVWLDAPVDELVRRMAADTHRRPLDRPAAEELLARRQAHLVEVADLRLDAREPTDVLVDRIVEAVEFTDGAAAEEPPAR
jgi:shikimate kinase